MYICNELLLFEGDTAPHYHPDVVVDDGDEHVARSHRGRRKLLPSAFVPALCLDRQGRRLSRISKIFPSRHRPSLVGPKIWENAILAYQIRQINTSSDIILHDKRLRPLKQKEQKIQDWWKNGQTATHYL
jgi:hypothetical protein